MRFPLFAMLVVLSFPCTEAFADEFKDLTKEYKAAKSTVKGAPKDRAERVKSDVSPILDKIGALATDEAFNFLVRELEEADKTMPEIAGACVKPLFAANFSKALGFVTKALPVKHPLVAKAALEVFAKTKEDISAADSDLVRFAQKVQDPEVKKSLPAALGKLDSLAAAKVLLALVQAPKGAKSEDANAFSSAVVAALKGTKNEEIKKWLSRGAFDAAGSDTAKLVVVVTLAGELKLADARSEVEKLSKHPAKDVSTAATTALGQIGFGDSADSIAAALEKLKGKGDLALRIQAMDALARTGTDEALEIIVKYARGKDLDMRAVAMGSLSLFPDKPEAQKALVEGLKDSNDNIRSAALLALRNMRAKFMIDPLIGVIENEKEEQYLKVEALKILVNLTQQNMGLEGGDWRKWWSVTGDRFELPKEGEKGKGVTSVKVHDLSYFGIEVTSKNIGFLVDISSSMLEQVPVRSEAERKQDEEEEEEPEGTTVVEKPKKDPGEAKPKPPPAGGPKARKIDILKKELCRVIQKLSADTQVNIVTFQKTFEPWQKELVPLGGAGKTRAIQYVQNLKNGVGTNVFDTLEFALKDKRINTIYLLTDGAPTAGRITQPQSILAEVQAMNRVRSVRIHCIGFGEDSPFLKELAKQNGGKYRFVDRY